MNCVVLQKNALTSIVGDNLRIWGSGVRISSGAPTNADNPRVLRSHVLPLSFLNENGRDTMSRNRRAESRKIHEVVHRLSALPVRLGRPYNCETAGKRSDFFRADFLCALAWDSAPGHSTTRRHRDLRSMVKPSLGKGEVESSILSGSTRKSLFNRHSWPVLFAVICHFKTEQNAKTTLQVVENPWSSFPRRSLEQTALRTS
jgi:hypothetical protein